MTEFIVNVAPVVWRNKFCVPVAPGAPAVIRPEPAEAPTVRVVPALRPPLTKSKVSVAPAKERV